MKSKRWMQSQFGDNEPAKAVVFAWLKPRSAVHARSPPPLNLSQEWLSGACVGMQGLGENECARER
ncbi:hypothetical protein SORBI_3004G180033 [Sorghum bicolor]|uniref:Uncharacterized protein n=1 Tax=Sorghum bicolor TaxID=4558 RepID=A0A1Z5RN85_SORBI|nr:hypothetical protein SORBI_3004G180033 [Sorghum bicolor]